MSTLHNHLKVHENCIACSSGKKNPQSIRLQFTKVSNTEVAATYLANSAHQGYTNLLHGGIASTLLDAAMTHSLLANGINALTAELNVRFYTPIHVGNIVEICGKLIKQRHGVYLLEATLTVATKIAAKATGKFIAPEKGTIIGYT